MTRRAHAQSRQLRRDVGDVEPGRFQKASRLPVRSEQRPDFFQQFGIAAALLAQKLLLLPGGHL